MDVRNVQMQKVSACESNNMKNWTETLQQIYEACAQSTWLKPKHRPGQSWLQYKNDDSNRGLVRPSLKM